MKEVILWDYEAQNTDRDSQTTVIEAADSNEKQARNITENLNTWSNHFMKSYSISITNTNQQLNEKKKKYKN